MHYKHTIVALIILVSSAIKAQDNSSNEYVQLKSKTVLVVMNELTESEIKNFKKDTAKLNQAKALLNARNETLKLAFQHAWTFSKMEFIGLKEGEEKVKTNSKEYYLCQLYGYKEYHEIAQMKFADQNSPQYTNYGQTGYYKSRSRREFTRDNLYIKFTENAKFFAAYSLPVVTPTEADIQVILKMTQCSFNNGIDMNYDRTTPYAKYKVAFENMLAKNAELFKTKTLLIEREDLTTDLTEAKIKSVYPYSFRLTEYKEIENAILKNDTSVLIVYIVPLLSPLGNLYTHYVIDLASGNAIGTVYPKPNAMGGGNTIKDRINEEILKKYIANVKP